MRLEKIQREFIILDQQKSPVFRYSLTFKNHIENCLEKNIKFFNHELQIEEPQARKNL